MYNDVSNGKFMTSYSYSNELHSTVFTGLSLKARQSQAKVITCEDVFLCLGLASRGKVFF